MPCVSWCTVWKGTPKDLMEHVLNDHNVPEGIRRVSLEMLFPPWTVTRQLYKESLSARHSGISNDALLVSELGLSLVHHYRVHRSGRPHIMFRGKYLAQLRALLLLKTADGSSGTTCPPGASTTSRTDGVDATPRPPRRRRRQRVQFRDMPDQIAPRLMEQDPLTVFDCLPDYGTDLEDELPSPDGSPMVISHGVSRLPERLEGYVDLTRILAEFITLPAIVSATGGGIYYPAGDSIGHRRPFPMGRCRRLGRLTIMGGHLRGRWAVRRVLRQLQRFRCWRGP